MRVDFTPAALAVVREVAAARAPAPLVFVFGSGCCEGTAPHLFANHRVGPTQREVGHAGDVPVFADEHVRALHGARTVVIDVEADPLADGFSAETAFGWRFVVRAPGHSQPVGYPPRVSVAPNAERFPPLPAARAARWLQFGKWDVTYFPSFVGIELEEARTDYARMRLRWRPELDQPAGVVHGGAIATLIDTVVVPAVGSAYDEPRPFFTVAMQVQYLERIAGEDAIAEGWVERRGRATVFCRVEVRSATGTLAATASIIYHVSQPREPATR
ncbi:MAG TPA: DUF779 domain-containing protein [Candidatus Binatia bacterium]|nr:DUF779 domain-containing protein [Candidatus Binatia bacterium]